ncbi:hypothetical protein [Klebsiella grimontii]|uniref:hypothetical protein n=1 Tax=Klebsiella grimontii TaxID=2058152 RepID=UPI001D0E509A|nr:hypothetical protein [Klebsiella grimontii]
MNDITELAQLRAELSNPAIGSKDHLRKLALSLVEALEKSQQERENWRTSFDNERFRADKLKAHIDEMTEEQTASINELSRIIQREIKAKREAEKRIAELESRTVTVKMPQRLQPGADGWDDWYVHSDDEGEYLKVDDVLAMLTAAGIKVEAE